MIFGAHVIVYSKDATASQIGQAEFMESLMQPDPLLRLYSSSHLHLGRSGRIILPA
jgi:hypothetical protein